MNYEVVVGAVITSVTINRVQETLLTWKLIFSSTLLCNFGRCGLFTFHSLGPNPLYPLRLPPASQALQCPGVALPCVCPLHHPPLGASASPYFNFQRIINDNAFPQLLCKVPSLPSLYQCLPTAPYPTAHPPVAQTKPWTPKCNLVDILSRIPWVEWWFAH